MKENIVKEKSYAFALKSRTAIREAKHAQSIILNSQFSILNLDNSQFR
jgi:hypothetical protein